MSTFGSPAKSYSDVRNINLKGGALGTGLIRWTPPVTGSGALNWSTNPFSSTDYGLYINASGNLVYSSLGSTTVIGAGGGGGGVPTWEQIFAADTTFNVAGITWTIDNSTGNNNVLTITNSGAGSGHTIQITNAGTGKDVNGTSGTWSVTKLGAAVFLSVASATINGAGAGITIGDSGANVITIGINTNTITMAKATTFSSTITVTDGLTDLISTSNIAAALRVTNNTMTTWGATASSAGALVVRSTTVTTGTLIRAQAAEGTITTGKYFEAWDSVAVSGVFSVGAAGATVIAGSAFATAALTLTNGDVVISSGKLLATAASNAGTAFVFTNSTATSATVFSIVGAGAFTGTTTTSWMTLTAVGLTTGTQVFVSANGLTTGIMMHLSHTTSVIADGGSMLRIASTSIDTGGATNGTLLDISSTAQIAGVIAEINTALTTGGALLITSSAAQTTTGYLLTLTSNSSTTAAGIFRMNANGLTSGIGQVITSSATAITGAGRLLFVNHTGTTSSTGTLVEFKTAAADATNATTLLALTMAASIVGVGLNVTSTTAMTTGSLIRASNSSAGAYATNGAISFTSTGAFTSNAVTDGGFVEIKANTTTAGTIVNVTGTSLTTGVGLVLSNGTSAITTGSLLRVTASGTGTLATNGIVGITHGGVYASTSNVDGGVLDVRASATTAGVIVNVVGAALTTGVAVSISNGTAATTTGSLLLVQAGGTGAVSGNGIVSFLHTGIYTSSTVGFVNVSASATTAGTVMTVTGAGVTTGTGFQISNVAMTSGKHFNILGAAGASMFSIALNGNTTIAGAALGTAALTLTNGDIVLSAGNVRAVGGITSSAPTGNGIGYATGAGGTVTQTTNRSTAVTLNKLTGTIQTDTTSLAALASAEFTFTNSTIAIGDVVLCTIRSGSSNVAGVAGITQIEVVTVAAGSCIISVMNNSTTTAETGAIIINFAVIKGVTS